ncbi:MAG: DNA-processing protein DprA [bacterium]
MDDLICTLALKKIPGLRNSHIFILLTHFANPCDIFNTNKTEFLKIGLRNDVIEILMNTRTIRTAFLHAIDEIEEASKNNIKIITFKSPAYPPNLLFVKNKPPVLYYKGNIKENLRFAVAIIGQRNPPDYACEITSQIAKKIGDAGFSVISGLAAGIDTAAHKTAIDGDINTIAYIGSGLLEPIYPSQNAELYQDIILKKGAIISELPLHEKLSAKNLVARDRLQSGSGLAVFAMSSPLSSGTLKTCSFAFKQKRPVFIPSYEPDIMDNYSNLGLKSLLNKSGVINFNVENIDLNDIIDEIRIVYNDLYEEKYDKTGYLLEQPNLFG